MYGKFQHETLMLYYHRFTRTEAGSGGDSDFDWAHIRAKIFDGREGKPRWTDKLKPSVAAANELVFVCARKVTGDVHVPMGSLSFSALVSPLLPTPASQRDTITDRSTQRVRLVSRRWMGWCTLAHIGFRYPSWTKGQLVQVAPERAGQRPGFAFCPGDEWDHEAIVISWLPTQDNEPFLLRPEVCSITDQ